MLECLESGYWSSTYFNCDCKHVTGIISLVQITNQFWNDFPIEVKISGFYSVKIHLSLLSQFGKVMNRSNLVYWIHSLQNVGFLKYLYEELKWFREVWYKSKINFKKDQSLINLRVQDTRISSAVSRHLKFLLGLLLLHSSVLTGSVDKSHDKFDNYSLVVSIVRCDIFFAYVHVPFGSYGQ